MADYVFNRIFSLIFVLRDFYIIMIRRRESKNLFEPDHGYELPADIAIHTIQLLYPVIAGKR